MFFYLVNKRPLHKHKAPVWLFMEKKSTGAGENQQAGKAEFLKPQSTDKQEASLTRSCRGPAVGLHSTFVKK